MESLIQPFIFKHAQTIGNFGGFFSQDVYFPTIKFIDYSKLSIAENLYALHPVALTLITTSDDLALQKKWLASVINEMKGFRMEKIL